MSVVIAWALLTGHPRVVHSDNPQWEILKKLPPRNWKKLRIDAESAEESRPPALTAVAFIDDSHGWSVGDGGTVLLTTDGGRAWKTTSVSENADLNSVFFTTPTRGWAAGSLNGKGVIYHTVDGGQTWNLQETIGEFEVSSVNGLSLGNDGSGWAVGNADRQGSVYGPYGIIFHTDDGGDHWQLQYRDVSENGLHAVQFLDAEHGWAMGPDQLLYTENAGLHWKERYRANRDRDEFLWDFDFKSVGNGWLTAGMHSGHLLRTQDAGQHWDSVVAPNGQPVLFFYSVRFRDSVQGWVGCSDGIVLSTADGGKSWATERTGVSQTIRALALTSHAVFAVGAEGVILKRQF